MDTHICSLRDGREVACDCEIGVAHDELVDDGALEDELVDPNDRFTGMADAAAEDVIE